MLRLRSHILSTDASSAYRHPSIPTLASHNIHRPLQPVARSRLHLVCLETGNHLRLMLTSVVVLRTVSEDIPEAVPSPFFFQRLASSPRARASSPSPSVYAQHDNWHDHPSAHPLGSHSNVNTRVGTHHPTPTSTVRDKINDIASFQLSLSLTFYTPTRSTIFAVP